MHIFNPDTDFAMTAKSDFYTPPRSVSLLRDRHALFPATYAAPGDAILIFPRREECATERLPYHDWCTGKGIRILRLPQKGSEMDTGALEAAPWGWNRVIRHLLLDRFSDLRGVPSEEEVEEIRRLSHRRLTIPFHREMQSALTQGIPAPREIFSVEETMEIFHRDRDLFIKAPWSSSGRGIIRTNDLEERHVRPWVSGIIATQGSVMVENALKRRLDCATEWIVRQKGDDKEVEFMGYSVFETSRRGKYKSNVVASQPELLGIIREAAPGFDEDFIELQRAAVRRLIAPGYNGPLGVDMLVTADGHVDPCVEVNLRMTMGLAQIFRQKTQ